MRDVHDEIKEPAHDDYKRCILLGYGPGLWMNMMEAHMKAVLEVAKQDVMRSWACYCSSYHGNIHQEFKDQSVYVRTRGKKQI